MLLFVVRGDWCVFFGLRCVAFSSLLSVVGLQTFGHSLRSSGMFSCLGTCVIHGHHRCGFINLLILNLLAVAM